MIDNKITAQDFKINSLPEWVFVMIFCILSLPLSNFTPPGLECITRIKNWLIAVRVQSKFPSGGTYVSGTIILDEKHGNFFYCQRVSLLLSNLLVWNVSSRRGFYLHNVTSIRLFRRDEILTYACDTRVFNMSHVSFAQCYHTCGWRMLITYESDVADQCFRFSKFRSILAAWHYQHLKMNTPFSRLAAPLPPSRSSSRRRDRMMHRR